MTACVFALPARADLPAGFVYLRDVAPDIAQDMRYAGPDNFTGARVPGYDAAECVARREAAEALQRAQRAAQAVGLSLKVFDCYRPERAVRAFLDWAKAPENGRTKSHYPHLSKDALVPSYIASRSTHPSGFAFDVTLVRQGAAATPAPQREDCTAPPRERESGAEGAGEPAAELDMGTSFDCFDTASNTGFARLTPEQRRSRALLVTIMERAGFRNYPGEWWHFSLARGSDGRSHDFPITPRPAR